MKCPLPNELIEQSLRISDYYIDEIRGGISKQVYRVTTQKKSWTKPLRAGFKTLFLFCKTLPTFLFYKIISPSFILKENNIFNKN